jgi:hypothetical protein
MANGLHDDDVSSAPTFGGLVSNPLDILTNDQLWNSQLLLAITCNHTKYSPKGKRVDNLCALGNALDLEAGSRGLQSPSAPFNLGKLRLVA